MSNRTKGTGFQVGPRSYAGYSADDRHWVAQYLRSCALQMRIEHRGSEAAEYARRADLIEQMADEVDGK